MISSQFNSPGGMFVLTVCMMEGAKALCDDGPAVKMGRLAVELHPRYAAKGIRVDQQKKQ